MLGADDELGSIGVGKLADLIGVAGDPSLDISGLRDIRLVIKGGGVVR
jgi:imidazolonepropionase-like amidohydrolase